MFGISFEIPSVKIDIRNIKSDIVYKLNPLYQLMYLFKGNKID